MRTWEKVLERTDVLWTINSIPAILLLTGGNKLWKIYTEKNYMRITAPITASLLYINRCGVTK